MTTRFSCDITQHLPVRIMQNLVYIFIFSFVFFLFVFFNKISLKILFVVNCRKKVEFTFFSFVDGVIH